MDDVQTILKLALMTGGAPFRGRGARRWHIVPLRSRCDPLELVCGLKELTVDRPAPVIAQAMAAGRLMP